jgi:iron complex outermembrane receptor protein
LEHNSVYGNEPVPAAGLAFNPAPATTIRASVSKGFRSPTIRELYLFTPANAHLKPERMVNYELGIAQQFFRQKLSLELTVFKANGENLITTVITSEGPKNENSGEFANSGIELAAKLNTNKYFSLNANYSYITMDKVILGTPEQKLFVSSAFKYNKFAVNMSFQHIHNLSTRIVPEITRESYSLLNAKVSYFFNKYIDVFIKGENLTNRKYTINYGYPMPGIIAFGGVNLHL